jgi:hypothetical protein
MPLYLAPFVFLRSYYCSVVFEWVRVFYYHSNTQINVDQSKRLYNLESFLVVYVRSVPLYMRVMGRPVGRLMISIFIICGQLSLVTRGPFHLTIMLLL